MAQLVDDQVVRGLGQGTAQEYERPGLVAVEPPEPRQGEEPRDVEDPDPQTLCSYRFEGGSTTFRMNYSDVEGWTVFEVFQTAD